MCFFPIFCLPFFWTKTSNPRHMPLRASPSGVGRVRRTVLVRQQLHWMAFFCKTKRYLLLNHGGFGWPDQLATFWCFCYKTMMVLWCFSDLKLFFYGAFPVIQTCLFYKKHASKTNHNRYRMLDCILMFGCTMISIVTIACQHSSHHPSCANTYMLLYMLDHLGWNAFPTLVCHKIYFWDPHREYLNIEAYKSNLIHQEWSSCAKLISVAFRLS